LYPDTTFEVSDILAQKADIPKSGKFKLRNILDSGFRSIAFGHTEWLVSEYSYKPEDRQAGGLFILEHSLGYPPYTQNEFTILSKY
jgi:hypothetical protein